MEREEAQPDAVIRLVVLGMPDSCKLDAIRTFATATAPATAETSSWNPFVAELSIAQQSIEVHLTDYRLDEPGPIEADVILIVVRLGSSSALAELEEKLLPLVSASTPMGMIATYANAYASADAEKVQEAARKGGAFCCIECDVVSGQNVMLAFDTALKTSLFQQKTAPSVRKASAHQQEGAKQAAKLAARQAAKLAVKEAAKQDKSPFAVALLTGHHTQARLLLEAAGGHASLAQCNLTEIPGPLFALLPMIKELDLQHNQLARLPVELRSIKRVLLAGNPLSAVPAVFRHAKWPKLRKYLDSVASRASNWRVRKLMLVGEEGVGKSTLARVLMQKGHKIDCSFNLSTDGVAISTVALKSGKTDEVRFNVWDFGGQVIFYSTHQFFLSPKAIYILAFDLSEPQFDRIEYWMWQVKLIEEQERKPQIVMVGTHADQCSTEEIEARLLMVKKKFPRQAFPSFTGIVLAVSCHSGKGVKKLKETLLSLSDDLNALVATSWVQLHSIALEKAAAGVRYCRWPQLEAWAEQCGVPPKQLDMAVSLLCDSGALLHFPGVQGLEEIVVLDPQWLANLMACIVTTKPNFVKEGLLLEKDLQHIFDPVLYPQDTHDALLALLSRFRLVHRIPAREAVLVPPLLPATRPTAQLLQLFPSKVPDREETFGRVYQFGKLPMGLFGRLAVAVLGITELAGLLYWRDGALMEGPEEMRMLLLYDPVVYRVSLYVRHQKSADARETALELWRVVVQSVQSLVKSFYPRLAANLSEKVPCIHCLRKGVHEEKVYNFTYEDVDRALRDKKPFLYCHEINSHHRAVLVTKLAPDIALEDLPQIEESAIEVEEVVGEGASGKIYRGILHTADGGSEAVAIKELVVDETRHSHKKKFLDFQGEAYAMSKLHHPNVVQLHGVMLHPPRLVLPYFPGGDLFLYLHGAQAMVRDTARDSMRDSARNSARDSARDSTRDSARDSARDSTRKSARESHRENQRECVTETESATVCERDNVVEDVIGGTQSDTGGDCVGEESVCEERVCEETSVESEADDESLPEDDDGFVEYVEERPWSERLSIAFDVASGLHYLQHISPPVIHRDLRSPNIFLTEDGTAVIGDFGLALVMRDDEVGGLLKTWQWLAPETIDSAQVRYDLRSDLYSLGVVFWELASQRLPFEEYAGDARYATPNNFKLIDIKRAIVSEDLRPTIPSECPPMFAELIRGLWQGKPEKRTTTERVLGVLAAAMGRSPPPALTPDPPVCRRIMPRVLAEESPAEEMESLLKSREWTISLQESIVEVNSKEEARDGGDSVLPRRTQPPVFGLALQLHEERLVAMATVGKAVWMGWSGGSVLVVEQRSDGSADVLQHMTMHRSPVTALVQVSDSQVWSCSTDGSLVAWDLATYQRLSQWFPHKEKSSVLSSLLYVSIRAPAAPSSRPLSKKRDFIMAGAAPPPAAAVARREIWCAEALNGKISIWDAKSRRLQHTIADDALVGMGRLARMGRLVWAATVSGKVSLYDAATFEAVGTFVAHGSSLSALACSGPLMFTASDSQIRVWRAGDAVELGCVAVQELHDAPITALVPVWDGRLIASASLDGSVFLWDGCTGAFVRTLAEELGPIDCLAGVGPFLWCVDVNRTLSIWRVGGEPESGVEQTVRRATAPAPEEDGDDSGGDDDDRCSPAGAEVAMADEEAPAPRWRRPSKPSPADKKSKRRRASATIASLLRGSDAVKAESGGKRVLGSHRDSDAK